MSEPQTYNTTSAEIGASNKRSLSVEEHFTAQDSKRARLDKSLETTFYDDCNDSMSVESLGNQVLNPLDGCFTHTGSSHWNEGSYPSYSEVDDSSGKVFLSPHASQMKESCQPHSSLLTSYEGSTSESDWRRVSLRATDMLTLEDPTLSEKRMHSHTTRSAHFEYEVSASDIDIGLSKIQRMSFSLDQGTICETIVSDSVLTPIVSCEMVSPTLPRFDICLGVVLVEVASTFQLEPDVPQTPLKLVPSGSMIKLRSCSLDKLCLLAATIAAPNKLRAAKSAKAKYTEKFVVSEYPVRITVFSTESEKAVVASLLSKAGLYLQHPTYEELRGERYDNPHYLRRPGTEMPDLDQLTLTSTCGVSDATDTLEESKISLVMRVFDTESSISSLPAAETSERLQSKLKDYQCTALAMMQERECGILHQSRFPTLWTDITEIDGAPKFRNKVTRRIESKPRMPCGGILADEMGLGKTLSILSLVCWTLDVAAADKICLGDERSKMTLIVAPKSTINGWQDQIKEHIIPGGVKFAIFHGSSRSCLSDSEPCDVIMTTYETLRSDWSIKKILYSQKWYRIVLDEAHHIRSRSSQVFRAVCDLDSRYRWCLTGTPIHNSLDDYGALLAFVRVNPFADKRSFNSWIAEPIKQQRPDSLRRLQDLVHATCLRRRKVQCNLTLDLPPQHEAVHWIDLSLEDAELYRFFKVKTASLASKLSRHSRTAKRTGFKTDTNVLALINILRLICDHGQDMIPTSAREMWRHRSNEALTFENIQSWQSKCDACGKALIADDMSTLTDYQLPCQHTFCDSCINRSTPDDADESVSCPKCSLDPISKDSQAGKVGISKAVQPSAKVIALTQNLHREQGNQGTQHHEAPVKSLVFSAWTKMLDLVQRHLEAAGFVIARIDGGCSLQQRGQAVRRFKEDAQCTVMLATIGSAGEGLNLTAASNVHLLEPHWNPMLEAQAINRVHRIGQQREVRTTRYITRNSIETYVQWIQQEKIKLISQSLDFTYVSDSDLYERRFEKLKQIINSHQYGT